MYNILIYEAYDKLSEVRDKWNTIYNENEELTPFQSYEWNETMIKRRICKGNVQLLVLDKCNKTILIAPLIIRKRISFTEISFLGENTHSDYLNFVYDKNLMFEDFKYFINELVSRYRCAVLKFNFINESSRINDFLFKLNLATIYYKTVCVGIPIPKTINEYYNSLSKNTRSSIRRKINKIGKIGDDIKFNFFIGEKLEEPIIRQVVDLYTARQKERYSNIITEKYVEYLIQGIKEKRNIFLGTCYIKGILAACHLGVISNKNDICIIINASNCNYKEYGVGNLLLYKSMEYLINENETLGDGTLKWKQYDITRGNEQYKYQFGGKDHFNCNFCLCKNDMVLTIFYILNKVKSKLHQLKKTLLSNILSIR